MLAYVVERVYWDDRPAAVMSVFATPERANAWIERQQFAFSDESFIHVRVIDVDLATAGS